MLPEQLYKNGQQFHTGHSEQKYTLVVVGLAEMQDVTMVGESAKIQESVNCLCFLKGDCLQEFERSPERGESILL